MNGALKALVFSFVLLLLSSGANAYYVDIVASNIAIPGGNITISGTVYNSTVQTGTSENVTNITVTASLSSTAYGINTTPTTGTSGAFVVSVNTTGLYGYRNVTVNFTSANITRTVPVYITNVTRVAATMLNLPPFSPGANLNLSVSSTTNAAVSNMTGRIYASDGSAPTSWGSSTAMLNGSGYGYMNFSIPSDATLGRYVISFENGAGYAFFVLTRYSTSVVTKDTTGTEKIAFTPNSQVTLETTIKSNGVGQAGLPVIYSIFDPSGGQITASAITTNAQGVASYNYSLTSASGTYRVKISVSGEETYTNFGIKTFTVRLESNEDSNFFFKFGGKQFFRPGEAITLNVVPVNVSNGNILGRGVEYNCTGTNSANGIGLLELKYVNGTNVTDKISAFGFANVTYAMTPSCAVNFTLSSPALTGSFALKVNVSTIRGVEVGTGFFSVQKYGLKVEPASAFGEKEMHTLLLPGDNASIKISAFNVSTGSAVSRELITSAKVTSIKPLDGGSEITSLNQTFYTNATWEDDPYILLQTPSSSGAHNVYVAATVNGEDLTGSTFYMGKYIMGYAQASGNRFGEGEGGGPGKNQGGSGQYISCSGTVEFNARVFDAKTMMPASSVTFLGLTQAREEMTGEDISNCLSVARSQATSSTGQTSINVTFSSSASCALSGFYFMMFNVSYQDKKDEIPGGFACKRLNFNPSTQINGQEGFNAKGTAAVTLVVNNATFANDSSRIITGGNLSVTRLINYNPLVGPTVLTPAATIKSDVTLAGTNYNSNVTIYPQNFSLTQWPTGFFDVSLQLQSSISGMIDSSSGGFASVPFDMFDNWYGEPGAGGPGSGGATMASATYSPGQWVQVKAWADLPTGDGTNPFAQTLNVSKVTMRLFSPESGAAYENISLNVTWSVTNVSSFPFGNFPGAPYTWENITIGFGLPSTIGSGFYMVQMTVTANDNSAANGTSVSTDTMFDLQVKGLTIGIPLRGEWTNPGGCSAPNMNISEFEMVFFNMSVPGGCGIPPNDICWNMGGANMPYSEGWNTSNWMTVKNTTGIDNRTLGSVCMHRSLNISYSIMGNEGGQSTSVPTVHYEYAVLVFKNTTHKFMFLGNRTNSTNTTFNSFVQNDIGNIFMLNETNELPIMRPDTYHTHEYLSLIADAGFVSFVNLTMLNSSTVSDSFSYVNRFVKNETFYIPIAVFSGADTLTTTASRKTLYNVTLPDLIEMNTEGFGIKGSIAPGMYIKFYNNNSITNVDGLAWLNISTVNNTRMMAFWSVNSTPKMSATFKNAPQFSVAAFRMFSQYTTLLPNTTKTLTLTNTSSCTNVTGGWLVDVTAVSTTNQAKLMCYATSFTETSSDRFWTVNDGPAGMAYGNKTVYVVLAPDNVSSQSPTGVYRYLFIDDDPYINVSQWCDGSNRGMSQENNPGCAGGGYAVNKIDIQNSERYASYGQASNGGALMRMGIDDIVQYNSTAVVVRFWQQTPERNNVVLDSTSQRVAMRICAQTLASKAINISSMTLGYRNWMQGVFPGSSAALNANLTIFDLNRTFNISINGDPINMSALIRLNTSQYDGCKVVEILPSGKQTIAGTNYVNQWLPGRNEVTGYVTDRSTANTGTEEMWGGQIEYWTSKTF